MKHISAWLVLIVFAFHWAHLSAKESPYDQFAWTVEYDAFRAAVLEGEDKKAAQIGDGFIDTAAQDLNYHNPEFGRLALEVGSAHHRSGNFERALELVGQAQAAFQFALGYSSRQSFDALVLLGDIALGAEEYDRALSHLQEAVVVAVIGDYGSDTPGLLVALADAYDQLDPRVAQSIRQAALYPDTD